MAVSRKGNDRNASRTTTWRCDDRLNCQAADRGVSGVTTNRTIFAKANERSDAMPASDTSVIAGGGLAGAKVGGLPGSGTPDELMEAAGISASRIAAAANWKD